VRVNSEVAVWHGSVRKGAEWDGFEDENKDKLIIKQSDWNEVNQAVKKFRFEPKLNEVLTELDAEVAMFSSEGPIYTKGLVDAITTGDVCKIIDLKTDRSWILGTLSRNHDQKLSQPREDGRLQTLV